ncbi:MAG: MmcQ/YjbR family DNA-binding protein [Pseudomonadota bacterium]
MTDLNAANAYCATLPGANLEVPFGPTTETWKVGGKIFALFGSDQDGPILKPQNREQGDFLKEIGVARPAPYLHRHGWILIPWNRFQDEADLQHRLLQSHQAVVAGLPKKLRPEPLP